MHSKTRNLYLVGLMGAGKTTVGRSLARKLGRLFVDSDHAIEERTGVSVSTIFEIEGEEGFRKREEQMIIELAEEGGRVVATGGGVVIRKENRQQLRKSGFVVYLNVPPSLIISRLRNDKTRPLLQVTDPLARLEALLKDRDPYYREVADLVIEGGKLNTQSVVQRILRESGMT